MRIVLRTIIAPGAVQSNDFVPKHIRAWLDGARDRDRPTVVLVDKVVLAPIARSWSCADEADRSSFANERVVLSVMVVQLLPGHGAR